MAGYFLVDRTKCDQVRYCCPKQGADFRCMADSRDLNVEVKSAIIDELGPGDYCGPVDSPAPRIRQLLNQSIKQLDKGDMNVVLLVDWSRPPIAEDYLVEALFGTSLVAGPIGGPLRWARDRDGKCGPNQMTRLGACGIIRWFGRDKVYGWFVHNPYASKPVPSHILDPWSQLMPGEGWRNGTPDQPPQKWR